MGLAGLLLVVGWAAAADEPLPARRLLQGDDARQAASLQARARQEAAAGKWPEALRAARDLQALCEKVLGADDGEAVNARQYVRALERRSAFDAGQQADYRRAQTASSEGEDLFHRGRYAQAQASFEQAVALCRRLLGEDYPDTATSVYNLAMTLDGQGRFRKRSRPAAPPWPSAAGC
jgi:tetratricopeptide (TPR) repeat protein